MPIAMNGVLLNAAVVIQKGKVLGVVPKTCLLYTSCKRCGRIYDLPCDDAIKKVVDTDMDGHEVQEIHYYYKGICKQCKEAVSYTHLDVYKRQDV